MRLLKTDLFDGLAQKLCKNDVSSINIMNMQVNRSFSSFASYEESYRHDFDIDVLGGSGTPHKSNKDV